MVGYNDAFITENAVVLSVGCINVTWKLVPSANLGPTPDLRSQRNSGGFHKIPGLPLGLLMPAPSLRTTGIISNISYTLIMQ